MDNFLKSLSIGSVLGFLIFIWFETHVIIEYFGWLSVVHAKEWKKYAEENIEAKYPYFLRETYPCWFTRLVGCPFCMIGFTFLWLYLPLSFYNGFWYTLVIAPVASLAFLIMEGLYKYVYGK